MFAVLPIRLWGVLEDIYRYSCVLELARLGPGRLTAPPTRVCAPALVVLYWWYFCKPSLFLAYICSRLLLLKYTYIFMAKYVYL